MDLDNVFCSDKGRDRREADPVFETNSVLRPSTSQHKAMSPVLRPLTSQLQAKSPALRPSTSQR